MTASLVLILIWLVLFERREDLRKQILTMSISIGVLSFLTCYFWWTRDWWHPLNLTGTKAGFEDFLMGFGAGGIMVAAYEEIFNKQMYKARGFHKYHVGGMTLLLLMIFVMEFLLDRGLTTFWACVATFTLVSLLIYSSRRDLLVHAFLSGILMAVASLTFYYVIILLSPNWIHNTYDWRHLSGYLFTGIPLEELVFWFLAGFVFGPFYEYWQGEKVRSLP